MHFRWSARQNGEVIIKSFPVDLLGKIAPSCVRWIGDFGLTLAA
jgi:hypothetical protein